MDLSSAVTSLILVSAFQSCGVPFVHWRYRRYLVNPVGWLDLGKTMITFSRLNPWSPFRDLIGVVTHPFTGITTQLPLFINPVTLPINTVSVRF